MTTVTRFSGWYIPAHEDRPRLRIQRNGKSEAALEWGSIRPDVSSVYRDSPRAIISGFQGDVLCDEQDHGKEVLLSIRDEAHGGKELLTQAFLMGQFAPPIVRSKAFRLLDVVVCPACHSRLDRHSNELVCAACLSRIVLRGGVPHFLSAGEAPCLRLTEQTPTNPYSADVLELLERTNDALVLDFGAGHTPREFLRPNVVYMDAVQYQWTDIVCTQPLLPFKDETFSAIVSQAVFEHLPDPHQAARELCRVLRPGGMIHIDTAFMQPLHGDPWHFFNMTHHGLRQVMAPFEEVRSGVKSYQFPSASLVMQFEAILPLLSPGRWRKRIEKWRDECRQGASALDDELGDVGRTVLAAGFYFEGRRPR
ncbi:MAG TPA: methyltransferase domain-containing protein [Nitrospira sp.]|nr:methyltransferase domain-containing protein [Nitrospira sp.]